MKNKKIINKQNIIIIVIVIIIVIISGFFYVKKLNANNDEKNENKIKNQESIKEKFNLIFDNEIHGNKYSIKDADKIYKDKEEIVYNAYKNKDSKDDKYEIDVNIPVINLKSDDVYKKNDLTQKIFVDKINEIYENVKNYTIYTVEYTGFVNQSILSVIIRATIKEGSNPQRVIFQTYNIDLKTKQEVIFEDIINEFNLNSKEIKEKIDLEIANQISKENKIQLTGYETFTRDFESEIYEINNIENFFIGQDNKIFILFAYGNNNFTSEFDIIEI